MTKNFGIGVVAWQRLSRVTDGPIIIVVWEQNVWTKTIYLKYGLW